MKFWNKIWISLLGFFFIFALFSILRLVFGVKDDSRYPKNTYSKPGNDPLKTIIILNPPCFNNEDHPHNSSKEIYTEKVGTKIALPVGKIIAVCSENSKIVEVKKNSINDRTYLNALNAGQTYVKLIKTGETPEEVVIKFQIIPRQKRTKK